MGFPDSGFPAGPGIMFTIVPIFIGIVFVIIIGTNIAKAIKGANQWKYNNAQPVLTVEARIVGKRADVSTYRHNDSDNIGHHHHSSTTYYVTFEVESGDRMEFKLAANEYGMLVEGDLGSLTFQGTRYLGFNRHKL
jgi:hypothetical protein